MRPVLVHERLVLRGPRRRRLPHAQLALFVAREAGHGAHRRGRVRARSIGRGRVRTHSIGAVDAPFRAHYLLPVTLGGLRCAEPPPPHGVRQRDVGHVPR